MPQVGDSLGNGDEVFETRELSGLPKETLRKEGTMGRGFPLMMLACIANVSICLALTPIGFSGWVVCLMVSIFLLIGYFIGEYDTGREVIDIRLGRTGARRKDMRDQIRDAIDFIDFVRRRRIPTDHITH